MASIGIQFVGPKPTNPPIDRSVALSTGAVPAPVLNVLQRACYNCHSSETRWPWYSHVAPASWLVVSDVNRGRGQLNFSRWDGYNVYDRADKLDKACEVISSGQMPPFQYRIIHGEARLSEQEIATICAWTRDESARLTRTGI